MAVRKLKPEVARVAKPHALEHNASSALNKLSGIVTLPKGKTADEVLCEAVQERYGLGEDSAAANR